MIHRTLRSILIGLFCVLALVACGLRAPQPSATPAPSGTATAIPTDSPLPPATLTPLRVPTITIEPTATPRAATATGAALTPTAGPSASPTVTATVGAGVDKAEFVADVTVPDGSDFAPGAAFVKTWQLKNVGTTTWTTDYALVFARGERMGGPDALPLPRAVAPGEAVDLSLDLTAPQNLGAYTGFWQLRGANGTLFGIGPAANEPVYVQIDVVVAAGSASPEPTGAAGALQVSAASLSVDQSAASGACPQTFVFTGSITSSGAGTVSYRLEAAADTPGFTFDLPPANNAILTGPGPRTFGVSYSLEFRGSVAGRAWLHILTPNDMTSEPVSFSLTCQAPTAGPGG